MRSLAGSVKTPFSRWAWLGEVGGVQRARRVLGKALGAFEEGTRTWIWRVWEDTLTRGIRKASAATSVNPEKAKQVILV